MKDQGTINDDAPLNILKLPEYSVDKDLQHVKNWGHIGKTWRGNKVRGMNTSRSY